jgi:UDP-N-acetylglucosamine 2-epimerase
MIEEVCIHTGQHYDYEMSQVFFETLELGAPKYHLGVGSGSHGWQTAEILRKTEDILKLEKPNVVVVFGDTNSTLAGALAASKLGVEVAHVEAGLRSFNRAMPEEINRVLTDHVSTLLFAPTLAAVRNLKAEGITNGVHLVGDVMYEIAMEYVRIANKESRILERLELEPHSYSVATVHRAENTDNHERLLSIVDAFREIANQETIIWPVHPRTRQHLQDVHLNGHRNGNNRLHLISPLSYLDMLQLESRARVVMTDSGGVQKEARWFEVPCVTLREETEWTETVEEGWNRLAGSQTESIVGAFAGALRTNRDNLPKNGQVPQAAASIVRALASHSR